MISGVTLIRNGNQLRYPWKLCIKQLLLICDEVIVNCDPGVVDDDGLCGEGTWYELQAMAAFEPRIKILISTWDMKNTGDGSELARQANLCLDHVTQPWVLYVQADELIHQKDASGIRNMLEHMHPSISQAELYRSYFWQYLDRRLFDHEIWLGRIFRAGSHRVGGDGMYLERLWGNVVRSPYWIYHYSRMGSEAQVNSRLRTLDRLFHPSYEVDAYRPFSYADEAKDKRIVPYLGTHPQGIPEFYS